MVWDDTRARAALRTLFDAAVAAADPRKVLAAHLPPKPRGRCIVVGCGKSAAVMAAAVEDAWPDVALEGTVVTPYGHNVPTRRIEVIEASHPVPDANSERGARRLLERVRGLGSGRSRARADLRRRIGIVRGAGSRPYARRQTGDQSCLARVRREHFGNELRAQAPLGHQGRPARRRRAAGTRRDSGDQRRARRRSGGDRLGTHGAGPDAHSTIRARSSPATASSPPRRSPRAWSRRQTRHPAPASCPTANSI